MCSSCVVARRRLANCRDRSATPPPNRPVELSSQRTSVQSNRSHESTASTLSQRSVNLIDSDGSSITSLTRRISSDLASEGYSSNRLEAFLNSLHPSVYQKNPRNWPAPTLAQYDAYKQAGDHLAAAHRAYRQTRHNYGRLSNMTAEEHIHLAELAISWGEATVMYANTKFS
jgi:hypothetical protein